MKKIFLVGVLFSLAACNQNDSSVSPTIEGSRTAEVIPSPSPSPSPTSTPDQERPNTPIKQENQQPSNTSVHPSQKDSGDTSVVSNQQEPSIKKVEQSATAVTSDATNIEYDSDNLPVEPQKLELKSQKTIKTSDATIWANEILSRGLQIDLSLEQIQADLWSVAILLSLEKQTLSSELIQGLRDLQGLRLQQLEINLLIENPSDKKIVIQNQAIEFCKEKYRASAPSADSICYFQLGYTQSQDEVDTFVKRASLQKELRILVGKESLLSLEKQYCSRKYKELAPPVNSRCDVILNGSDAEYSEEEIKVMQMERKRQGCEKLAAMGDDFQRCMGSN